jgi:hypothetical protein
LPHSSFSNERIRLPRISLPEFIRNPSLPFFKKPNSILDAID